MKRLHFAGYDFSSGPDGTVIDRQVVGAEAFKPGDRVTYKDLNLWSWKGTVTSCQGSKTFVKWDDTDYGPTEQWTPNLRGL